MPISAEAGVMPALVKASLTFSIASGGVTTYQPEPSSFKSSAPASNTMSSILSSLACSLGTTISPLRWNIQPTAPASARLPPFLLIRCRNSPTTRLRLVVTAWMSIPTPPGPYPSNVTSSYCSPSSWPVPRSTARSMFSFGMFSFLPARMAARRRGLELGSPPPMRAAMVISRMTRVNTRPRFGSLAAFFRLMAQYAQLDFHVAYCGMRGAEAGHDPEFGHSVKWDVPLLDGYAWTHVPNHGSGAESFFGLRNPGLWKFIRKGQFDALVCFVSYRRATFCISFLAAKATRAAFLFGADTITLAPLDGRMWKRPIKRFTWPLLFRLADQVIVPSSGTRELMLSLGIPEERVTLTPNIVENDWWIEQSASVDRAAVRHSWGASADDMIVLFCAKIQAWKGLLDLLRAFAEPDFPRAFLS